MRPSVSRTHRSRWHVSTFVDRFQEARNSRAVASGKRSSGALASVMSDRPGRAAPAAHMKPQIGKGPPALRPKPERDFGASADAGFDRALFPDQPHVEIAMAPLGQAVSVI